MRRSAGRRAWASGDTKTPSGDASGLQLMVFSTRAAGRHALPSRGTVSIGRADGCDVRIDDPSVSRRHAVLHIDPRVSIRDEGSANGTWVHARADGQDTAPLSDVRLEPGRAVDLAVGDSFTVGSVLVTLCGPARSTSRWATRSPSAPCWSPCAARTLPATAT